MSKEMKKRTMIYSNVKANKRKAEEITKIKEEHINLDDEVIIGLSHEPEKDNTKVKENKKSKKKKVKNNKNKLKPSKSNQKIQNNIKRKPKRKITKKMLKIRIITALVILFIIICTGLVVLCMKIPLFNVTEISITIDNKKILEEEEIKELSQIIEGDNIIGISKRDVIDCIKSNPYVENVKVKKSLPSTVRIEVEERTVRFQLEHNDKYINIDNQGYILDETTERSDVILITSYSTEDLTFGNRLSEKDLEKLSDVIQIIQEAKNQEIDNEITRIDIKSSNNYTIYMDNCGKIVHLGSTNLINDKFAYIKKIMELEKDYEGEIIVNVDYNKGEYPYFREKV